jgi:hypothetical protein
MHCLKPLILLGFCLCFMGCSISAKMKKLDPEELDHYRALRVYMDQPDARGIRNEDERKAYLGLKTREERDQWLKDEGHWERFYKYDPHIREKIVFGQVQTGWDKHMVYMSWGYPFTRRKLPGRNAMRSEMLVYRFEEAQDGTHQVWVRGSKTEYKAVRLYIQEVVVDDDRVTEIKKKDSAW